MAREKVMSIVLDPLRRAGSAALDVIRIRDEKRRKELLERIPLCYRDMKRCSEPCLGVLWSDVG
jgi:hypothetical protein